MKTPYNKMGVRRVINAASCLTRLGGSIPHPKVYQAMQDASKTFVQIPELQQWAGRAIAQVTGAEAGLPTAGASNAITLAAAACIMKCTDLEQYDPLQLETWTYLIKKLPMHSHGLKTQFIVQANNRNTYDHAVECAGGIFTEVEPTEQALKKAYSKDTAAYYYTVRSAASAQPLEVVIKIAHSLNTPVIVDAAAELPPKMNLTRYTLAGADLVIFSGGKFIAGPNNSGILAGRADLIKLAHLQAYPFHGVGRASKMSRETIVGLITALNLYMEEDEEQNYTKWLAIAQWIREQLADLPGVESGIDHQSTIEEDHPIVPICYMKLNECIAGIGGKDLGIKLRDGNPSIETLYEPGFILKVPKEKLVINPEFLQPSEAETVVKEIKRILRTARK